MPIPVQVKVQDGGDGHPLKEAKVELLVGESEADLKTDKDGITTHLLEDESKGKSLHYFVSKSGYPESSSGWEQIGDEKIECTVSLSPAPPDPAKPWTYFQVIFLILALVIVLPLNMVTPRQSEPPAVYVSFLVLLLASLFFVARWPLRLRRTMLFVGFVDTCILWCGYNLSSMDYMIGVFIGSWTVLLIFVLILDMLRSKLQKLSFLKSIVRERPKF